MFKAIKTVFNTTAHVVESAGNVIVLGLESAEQAATAAKTVTRTSTDMWVNSSLAEARAEAKELGITADNYISSVEAEKLDTKALLFGTKESKSK